MAQIVHAAVMLAIFPFPAASLALNSSSAEDAVEEVADGFNISSEKAKVIIPSNSTGDGSTFDELALMEETAHMDENETLTVTPEHVYQVPDVESFPGCMCDWNEGFSSGWSCEATIIFPKAMAGKPCCCCRASCLAENRCSNDECMLLGVDQAAEIEAERIAAEKAAKESPIPPSQFGSAKMTLVRLPQGDCTSRGPLDACKKQGLYPMCFSYSKGRQRDGGKPGCKVTNRGRTMKCDQEQNCWWFADYPKHPYSHMNFENLKNFGINPLKFGGFCMYAANGGTNQGLVLNGKGPAAWAPNNPKSRAAYKITGADGKEWTANEQSAMGWQTVCVNEKPEPYPPQYRR